MVYKYRVENLPVALLILSRPRPLAFGGPELTSPVTLAARLQFVAAVAVAPRQSLGFFQISNPDLGRDIQSNLHCHGYCHFHRSTCSLRSLVGFSDPETRNIEHCLSTNQPYLLLSPS